MKEKTTKNYCENWSTLQGHVCINVADDAATWSKHVTTCKKKTCVCIKGNAKRNGI